MPTERRNPRRRVPPRDPARRRRYYGLLGRARAASSLAQRRALVARAEALMVWVEADGQAEAGMADQRSTTPRPRPPHQDAVKRR